MDLIEIEQRPPHPQELRPPRILGTSFGAPFNRLTWSGSAFHLFTALQREGALIGAVEVGSTVNERISQAASFAPDRRRWMQRYMADASPLTSVLRAARTRVAVKRAAPLSERADIVLQLGNWYDSSQLPGMSRYATYCDGNLAVYMRRPDAVLRPDTRGVRAAMRAEQRIYDHMDVIFTMSEWLRRSFIEDFSQDPNKVKAVGAGPNLAELPSPPTDRRWDPARLLFVGKGDFARKGGPILLKAFERVHERDRDAELWIVGPQRDPAPPPGVRYFGRIARTAAGGQQRFSEIMERATGFVLPSVFEPFGVSFLEAMAYGLPSCVGTESCAMPEIIESGVAGTAGTAGRRGCARRPSADAGQRTGPRERDGSSGTTSDVGALHLASGVRADARGVPGACGPGNAAERTRLELEATLGIGRLRSRNWSRRGRGATARRVDLLGAMLFVAVLLAGCSGALSAADDADRVRGNGCTRTNRVPAALQRDEPVEYPNRQTGNGRARQRWTRQHDLAAPYLGPNPVCISGLHSRPQAVEGPGLHREHSQHRHGSQTAAAGPLAASALHIPLPRYAHPSDGGDRQLILWSPKTGDGLGDSGSSTTARATGSPRTSRRELARAPRRYPSGTRTRTTGPAVRSSSAAVPPTRRKRGLQTFRIRADIILTRRTRWSHHAGEQVWGVGASNGYHYNTAWSGVPPRGFSSRGAGVPYLAGLVRKCEIEQGHIDHALAFVYPRTTARFVFPATKSD